MLLVWLLLFVFCKWTAAGKGEVLLMSRQMYRCFIGLSFVIYVIVICETIDSILINPC